MVTLVGPSWGSPRHLQDGLGTPEMGSKWALREPEEGSKNAPEQAKSANNLALTIFALVGPAWGSPGPLQDGLGRPTRGSKRTT